MSAPSRLTKAHVFNSLVVAVVLSSIAAIPHRPSIITRHDRPDSLYVALGADYADVLVRVKTSEGVLVAPEWVLTAAHVVQSIGPFDAPLHVSAGDETYSVEKIISHPDWGDEWKDLLYLPDLALIKLDRPVQGVRQVELYPWNDELGQVLTLVGRGDTGTGETGPLPERDGIVRGATNRVDAINETALFTYFDEGESATELEGTGGGGDSGGPALVERDGQLYLIGISSHSLSEEDEAGRYYTFDAYVRVSAYRDWIETIIETDAPASEAWEVPSRFDGTWPDTPPAHLAADFFDAYEQGTVAAIESFYERHDDLSSQTITERAQRIYDALYATYGPFTIHGYSHDGPTKIRVLVHSEAQDGYRSLVFNVEPDPPHHLARFYMLWEQPPPPDIWR